jgi:hypothetical protein
VGEPGPYGSNPLGYFPGLDLVSRSKNNTPTTGLHYQNDFTSNVRLDLTGGFFLNNSYYISPFGDSFNKDMRPYGDARVTWRVASFWTLAGGFAFAQEEMKNTFVTDSNSDIFPLRRNNEGIYLDNHFTLLKNKLFSMPAYARRFIRPHLFRETSTIRRRVPTFPRIRLRD